MKTVFLARNAMATRFELILHGVDEGNLRAAGEAALDEIDRLEAQLSLFRTSSEVAHVNAKAAMEPVRVSHPVFRLLKHAIELSQLTRGAFDITVAPLMRAWGFAQNNPHEPTPECLAELASITGMQHVLLDDASCTVRFDQPGVMIDLGAIGKGYAIGEAVEILKESGIQNALLHGGTSTVYGMGLKPDGSKWTVAIEDPASSDRTARDNTGMHRLVLKDWHADVAPEASQPILDPIELADQALSVSTPRGKCFESEGRVLGHVLDPRTGRPAVAAQLAAVRSSSATESDALSTALLVLGTSEQKHLEKLRPDLKTWVV
jgi:FAD:protein FMN transferase